jgi:hypothetical protein
MHTATGEILGTLAYMSPEQISGQSRGLDARSDVYALGVLFYEALAGRLPYDIQGLSLADAARTICEEEPTRLGSLRSDLRGDIDTIVCRALEKDPERRYASAAELGRDIGRYLRDRPIAARPPSAIYQLRKFARRNRALVGGVAATLVTLLVGVAVATTLAFRVSRENDSLQWMVYRTAIRSAEEALATGDRPLAREILAAEPLRASLRGWEWRHLWSRAEEEGLQIPAPQPASASPPLVHVDGKVLEYRIDLRGYRFDTDTGEQLAKYAGAVLGLALGNWIKYRIDREWVFLRSRK